MCRDGRALVDNGEAAHAAGTRTLAAAARRPVRPVRLPHLTRHPQRADRARAIAVVGAGGDPPPGPVQGRPADPQPRPADAFFQGRHAYPGRPTDSGDVAGPGAGVSVTAPVEAVVVSGGGSPLVGP